MTKQVKLKPAMIKAARKLSLPPDTWAPEARPDISNTHHVLFRKGPWLSSGWLQVLRDSFTFELPFDTHDSIHDTVTSVPVIGRRHGYHVVRELLKLSGMGLNTSPASRLDGLNIALNNVAEGSQSATSLPPDEAERLRRCGKSVLAQIPFIELGSNELGGRFPVGSMHDANG